MKITLTADDGQEHTFDVPDDARITKSPASACSAAVCNDAMDLSLELYAIAHGFEFDEDEMHQKFRNIPSVHNSIRQMAYRLTERQNRRSEAAEG